MRQKKDLEAYASQVRHLLRVTFHFLRLTLHVLFWSGRWDLNRTPSPVRP
jgi:hypothetical protein